jgi:hypothetical protein
MDFQSSTWNLYPYVILRPEDYANVPFEVLLQHPRVKMVRPEFIDTFIRINGPNKTKFVHYLNGVQRHYLMGLPIQAPMIMTQTKTIINPSFEVVEYTSPVVLTEFEMQSNPIYPVQINERRSFFYYTRDVGYFHIETYVTMYDDRLHYDEVCIFQDPNNFSIVGDANTTPFRDIVFHWNIIQYNSFYNHTKIPIDNYDFSINSIIQEVNLSECCTQESTFGHWDLYLKLLKEHQRLSKMSKDKFETERKKAISFLTSDDISNMRTLYKGVNLRMVYENLVANRLIPLLEQEECELDDDAWLFGDIDFTGIQEPLDY